MFRVHQLRFSVDAFNATDADSTYGSLLASFADSVQFYTVEVYDGLTNVHNLVHDSENATGTSLGVLVLFFSVESTRVIDNLGTFLF